MSAIHVSRFDAEMGGANASDPSQQAPRLIEFLTPSQARAYRPPTEALLVGTNHINRGSVFVIGGAPGVGKSRASVALAVAGATQEPWFGLPIHRAFRTMIVQNENGRIRLSDEFFALNCDKLENFLRISPPPPYGLALRNPAFAQQLKSEMDAFLPDILLIDPWNAVAQDDKARDYLETFDLIRSIVPAGDDAPAIGIVAHTRKPKQDERSNGRGLLNLLAGSYVLGSVPRAAFVIQPASDAPEDSRVVFTCCKNNDGPMGEQSAWIRCNGLFQPVTDFDWDEFRGKNVPGRVSITAEDMAAIFAYGQRTLSRQEAVNQLIENTGCEKSAAYNALKLNGRFAAHLSEASTKGLLKWTP